MSGDGSRVGPKKEFMRNFKLGQKLWFVPYPMGSKTYDKGRFVTITKLGHLWMYGDNREKIDPETLKAFGGRAGQVYLTKEEHDVLVACNRAWHQIRAIMNARYAVPTYLELEQLQEIAKTLRIELS